MIFRGSSRICLITPPVIKDIDLFLIRLERALSGGIRLLQYRNKTFTKREAFRAALRIRDLTRRYQALFIINDEVDLALASDADGLHLGQEDFPLKWARKILGRRKIIGVSTHNLEEAREAEEGLADYVGVGSVFPSSTKEGAVTVGLGGLKSITERISVPVLAIGGITASNLESVLEAGASGAAVISAVWDAESIERAAGGLLERVSRWESRKGIGH